jgi:aqualysin 1
MHRIRLAVISGVLIGLAACSDKPTDVDLTAPDAQASFNRQELAPLLMVPQELSDRAIPNHYIVVLRESTDATGVARAVSVTPHFVYTTAIQGFAAELTTSQVNRLRRHRDVQFIEQDGIVTTMQQTKPAVPSSEPDVPAEPRGGIIGMPVQQPATWGIDRTDFPFLPLNNRYRYTNTGLNVRAYVLDTGILTAHTQFGGRATVGFDAFGGNGQDCNGHGTHVAGTIGGTTYGIAKSVRLVAVRVLNCQGSGTNAGVIAGVDYVTNVAVLPAVANMSLGGSFSSALNKAVETSISYGISYVLAAGNSNANACNFSPASAPNGLTVGATTPTDLRAAFSNFGTCLDIFAPGQNITSAWHTSNVAINTISGTSMAAPHVAGKVALFLQARPTATPALVTKVIKDMATLNLVGDPGLGSPNLLLNRWNWSLPGTDAVDYEPHGGSYTTVAQGYHHGWLRGQAGRDFDLCLQRLVSGVWQTLQCSASVTPNEYIVRLAPAGTYRWRINSFNGAGTYDMFARKP